MDALCSVVGSALRWCGYVGLWLLKRLIFVVAVVTVLGLLGRSAHATVGYGGCTAPGMMCIQGNSVGVDVTARQNGNSVPQTPSAGAMSVVIPIAVTVAAVGVAAVAVPAAGTAVIAGDVMASVGMTAIRGGIIGGVALATLMNRLGGDVRLDANGNVVAPATSPNAGDSGFNGSYWSGASGQKFASPQAACKSFAGGGMTYNSVTAVDATTYNCNLFNSNNGVIYWGVYQATQVSSCVAGYVMSGGVCVTDPNGPTQPATDAQIHNAIKAHPASWPDVYNDAGCPKYGNVLTNVPGAGGNDPCSVMFMDSRTGFGVSFSTGGSSWTNNGCAVNSASCPSATVTTAPTTDSSTKVNADGSKTTTTNTTSKTTTVTGTSDRTNPVQGQTTTTTSTAVTVTNPDGSTTTTTTTTTDQAPPATAGNPANQDKPQPTTATFGAGDWKLYTPKEKTFAQVMQGFVSRVQAMPWYTSMSNFFMVSVAGSCPHWVVPASRYTPALDGTQFFCGTWALNLYALGGVVTMLVAAWYAWRIAFL